MTVPSVYSLIQEAAQALLDQQGADHHPYDTSEPPLAGFCSKCGRLWPCPTENLRVALEEARASTSAQVAP